MQADHPLKITHQDLIALAGEARGSITHIYLHWTAGHYGKAYDEYHLNIDKNGEVYQTCSALTERKAHTYKRNTGAVGIAVCAAYNAVYKTDGTIDFGSEPPTRAQLVSLAWVIALLCLSLGLEIKAPNIMTHAEAAVIDGYGPNSGDSDMRWDLYYLHDFTDNNRLRLGGVLIREMAKKCFETIKPKPDELFQVPLVCGY